MAGARIAKERWLMSSLRQDEERLIREILGYFVRNPNAADSLEGVAHWRLLDETIHRTVAETGSALERLVAEGYLQRVPVPGSAHIYTLNPQKRKQAEQFVTEDDSPSRKP